MILPDPEEMAHALGPLAHDPEFLGAVFDAFPFQVVVKSLRSETFGQFLIWNRAAEIATGIAAGEALGRTDVDFFPPSEVEDFRLADLAVLEKREPVEIEAEEIMTREQGKRILRTRKTPIFAGDGSPLALIPSLCDNRTIH